MQAGKPGSRVRARSYSTFGRQRPCLLQTACVFRLMAPAYARILGDWVAAGQHIGHHVHMHPLLRETSAQDFLHEISVADTVFARLFVEGVALVLPSEALDAEPPMHTAPIKRVSAGNSVTLVAECGFRA